MMKRYIHSLVLTLSSCWLLLTAGCFSSDSSKPSEAEKSTTDQSSTITEPLVAESSVAEPMITEPDAYEPPSEAGYIGSESCTQCHAEIAQRYATHPMSESAYQRVDF